VCEVWEGGDLGRENDPPFSLQIWILLLECAFCVKLPCHSDVVYVQGS
jgi:hypothetical protein